MTGMPAPGMYSSTTKNAGCELRSSAAPIIGDQFGV
jgi:hypothetical protein